LKREPVAAEVTLAQAPEAEVAEIDAPAAKAPEAEPEDDKPKRRGWWSLSR